MENFKVIDFRFLSTEDNYDLSYWWWLRPYEYQAVFDQIENSNGHKPKIHNTSCGYEPAVMLKFAHALNKVGDCLHSDLREDVVDNIEIKQYDMTKREESLRERFDYMVSISALEHFPKEDLIQTLFNLWDQVKVGGKLICTFDYPRFELEIFEDLLGAKCHKGIIY